MWQARIGRGKSEERKPADTGPQDAEEDMQFFKRVVRPFLFELGNGCVLLRAEV